MACILVLTSDLPFFPGKNGHDFFNIRHLARTHRVGVVAPRYDAYPAAGIENLRKIAQHTYLWPDPPGPYQLFITEQADGAIPAWVLRLPAKWRQRLLARLLGLAGQPADAGDRLAILANCAPQLMRALCTHHWQAMVVIQTSLAPWQGFLPRNGAKVLYFHDVRSDYLARSVPRPSVGELGRIHRQEQTATDLADVVGFVSELDKERARRHLRLPPDQQVAPIPVDTGYFVPRPADHSKDPRRIILFTGHLSHPPNVDAVHYFITQVWPLVLETCPDAVFQAAGMAPDPSLSSLLAGAAQAELHANVPDIRPYFWNANAYVVPMRYGGGVRQKIFEAWAMQVPVVSTTMGVEGTGAEPERHCLLADTPRALADLLTTVLARGVPPGMLDAAASLVHRNHAIDTAAGAFEKLVRTGISRRARAPYRLLHDLRWMEIGKAGGTEQMTHELLHAISRIDRRNHFRTYVPRSTYFEWDLDPAFHCRPHFSDQIPRKHEALLATLANRLAESLNRPPLLSPEMRTLRAWHRMDFDLVHSIGGYIHPDLHAFPHILTMHDLQHLAHPGFFTPEQWEERERLFRDSANRAAHIIAVSEFTRHDIHARYGIPLDRITTIWNIPSRHAWVRLSGDRQAAILHRLGLVNPFILFPAHCWPHKNHARLIEAFALIRPHIDPRLQLVLTGRPFPPDHPALALIAQYGLQDRVVHLGFRSALEMKALFQGCLLLAFPSLFEGFGMPVAEAIIAGKPVACSRTTSLPEIAGEAALTFDPEDVHDIGGRLLEIIHGGEQRRRLAGAAAQRKSLFSSRLIAIKTLDLYQRVHAALHQD